MTKKRICTGILFAVLLLAGIVFLVPVVLTMIGSFLIGGRVSANG